MGVLSELAPAKVFQFFEEICGIPHGSGNTKKISDYIVEFAKERKLRYIQDEYNNVIVFKDGSSGYENSEPVIVQGHMDMVCEKDGDCKIDFETDGLRLVLEDGVIRADGTTLGGDDGIAVAMALALLDSKDIAHPPLECVFTVDEEIGMLGAAAIDCSSLKGHRMLNLDSEEEGHLLVSCAGGVCATCHIPVEYEKCDSSFDTFVLSIEGLTGGHSGVEIIRQRANANKQLARVLYNIGRNMSYKLVSVRGGLKDNAIPIKSEAVLCINDENADNIFEFVEKQENILRHEFQSTDPDLRICIKRVEKGCAIVMTEASKGKVLSSLVAMPNGVIRMSNDIDGLVQTSLNLGILETDGKEVTASFSVRSSIQSEKEYITERLCAIANLCGGRVDVQGDYPAWEYKKDSPLRELMIEVFKEQYGYEPVIEAIHAGVECGLFAGKIDNLDCVSFGPDMKAIHTSRESMDAFSVQRTWEYVLRILEKLK